ncbi:MULTISPECIES: hypothetical protein [unclassified Microcoleus]|jgi:hypothetical protein|uniref:hypothetical protein n=1 Tax=unclassified Microcoleus TaxID=2642155 RepID=UPI001DC9FAA5|nr:MULTISPECIES: hypothetical protein [unclassified Microcoleus]MCC3444334.1 hypothetical protein [Microcoleus sp. PH2017_03_ELD_O_A]MCC3469917.1 hypothetical protein [Microcoleus sp. PH2017_06_SFM_O_A]MCC3502019.1 hypothetical protein [Microcoleus sp. PH2017_19_SFW_U_A]TAE16878.1 MAG: hypothetical protein EAZ94_00610 [Oscillatoriales cyanobacterium]MCC3413189.1 hypothetical protein [Microcoleus sp. PH2017_02_FOX_O_A]
MSNTELVTESLTEHQWGIAHAIAQTLVKEQTDVNELGKAIAYLRASVNESNAGARFFKYLKTLVSNGRQIGHSKKTSDYYQNIDEACTKYLQSEQTNPQKMLEILGWSARLMRYYREAVPIEEIVAPVAESARQAEIAQVMQSEKFEIGQILAATVIAVKANKVTYEILGTIKLTEKEPKKASSLQEGQAVAVKIVAIKEDGNLKSVKCVD